jgi:heptaprenyl diphosphate synthase
MKNSTAKLSLLGVLTALSLALSVMETMILPFSVIPIPGFRIGFSNIVILVSIYLLGAFPSIAIILVRTAAVFAFGGNLTAFFFSLTGGLCAVIVMLILRNTKQFSFFGLSAGGAAAHAVGQIGAAMIMTGTWEIIGYLPLLVWISIAAGLLTATLAIPVFKAADAASRSPGI